MIMIDLDDTHLTTLGLSVYQRMGLEDAQALWEHEGVHAKCPGVYKKYIKGRSRPAPGERCWSPAGKGTWHVGYGHCIAHGGAKREGRAEGAWLMAFAYAEEYDLSPWESLLYVIRITAGRVRYCEQVLATANSDKELEGRVKEGDPLGVSVGEDGNATLSEGRNLSWWVDTSERERILLAKVSKAAIDAGVAQLLVEQTLREGNALADHDLAVWNALRESGMTKENLDLVLGAMKANLASLGESQAGDSSKNLGKMLPSGGIVDGDVIE